jgi:hypothetical protein
MTSVLRPPTLWRKRRQVNESRGVGGISKGLLAKNPDSTRRPWKDNSAKGRPFSQLGGLVVLRCSPSVETAPSSFARR